MSFYQKSNKENEIDQIDALLEKFKDVISDYNKETGANIPTEYNLDLSESQQKAFEKFKKGDSLLILGPGGTGKSKLIKEFFKYNKRHNQFKTMYLTSTTGISAYNIGGITINSFMGIGTGQESVEILLKRLRYKIHIKNRIRQTDILVIDEISMMSAAVFEKIDQICKILKKNYKPFGGIQLVLTGDFLQLETVFDQKFDKDTRLIVQSDLFKQMFKKSTIVLTENFRQKNDNKYINLLLRLRKGEQTEQDIEILNSRLSHSKIKNDIIHLVSSNKKAQAINTKELNKIDADDKTFEMSCTKSGNKDTCDFLEKELSLQFNQKGLVNITLRKGCRVLLIKNIDVTNGLVNGSVGMVEDFQSLGVVVRFDNGVTQTIQPCEWQLELDGSSVTFKQIPLLLAYSITIHKSQSLSLDSAVLDLADCFCNHMVYVALSRVRSLDGLYLKSFNESKITVNQTLLEFIQTVENSEKCLV
jgi:ATP-dependent DNA helicase PIF1